VNVFVKVIMADGLKIFTAKDAEDRSEEPFSPHAILGVLCG
jgi:hypothetical protein